MSLASSTTLGVLAGLATAGLWATTAICFEWSSRRLGSYAVNVLRLVLALVLFVALSLVREGTLLPVGLSPAAWLYLAASGLVGFVIGDLMLFQSFVLIGARLGMLIYASVPLMTALLGWAVLGEDMGARGVLGMFVTVAGIAMAVISKREEGRVAHGSERSSRRLGILLAIGGSAGQAVGLLLGKQGAAGIDSFAATEIRALVGVLGFAIATAALGRLREIAGVVAGAFARSSINGALAPSPSSRETHRVLTLSARETRRALAVLALGALLGPFLGVSLGLLSAQLVPLGMASTLMATVPVLLIPVAVFAFQERVRPAEIAGALIAIAGVALLVA